MYFVVSKIQKQFFSQIFENNVPWNELVKQIKGSTIVELFKNDILEKHHFNEYFDSNYRRK